MSEVNFDTLINYLIKIPGVGPDIAKGVHTNGYWWIKFSIDINHQLAWHVVQELGHVVNYISLNERLPSTFYPVSPPPYMNGGPSDFLYWIIESESADFTPDNLCQWLEGRLPQPVEIIEEWLMNNDDRDSRFT